MDDVLGSAHCAVHVVTWTGKRAQSVSPCQQSSPTCSYTCTSAHMAHNARHLAHNCEGGRLGYAPKSLSGQNPCLRSPSQEGRALGGEYRSSWDGGGRGACEPIRTFTTSARRVCTLQLKGGEDWLTPAQLAPRRASSSIKRACLPRTAGATCLLSLETCTYYRSVNAETHLAHLLCIQRAFLQLYFNLQLCCFSLSNFDALSVKYFKEFPL